MSMSPLFRGFAAVLGLAAVLPLGAVAQTNYAPQGTEYAVAGILPGDQVWPALAVNAAGGYVVWQDNITDGAGTGISARRLDSTFSGTFASIRVNQSAAGNQERPQAAMLANGGTVFVWQGGVAGRQNIFARFMTEAGTWSPENEIRVNTFTNHARRNPAVAGLADGGAVVVWGGFGQEADTNAFQGVFGQRFSAAGEKLGGEFQVNVTIPYNQRTPAVAARSGGGFVVVWVSEQQRFENSVDIYGRLYDAAGGATTGEFLVNTSTNICACPRVAGAADGTFVVTWQERNAYDRDNGWDIMARAFSSSIVGGTVSRLNTYTYGDQFLPSLAWSGNDYLVVWSSLGQDGSREGVYGRTLAATGLPVGPEFRVNTRTVSQQLHPAVASDGAGHFLTAWTTFGGGLESFDLAAQRYAYAQEPLLAPAAPHVTVISSNTLAVSWPKLAGFNVAGYEVYADGAVSAAATVTNNVWRATGLAPGSTHTYRLAYVLADGRRSPLSPASQPKTTYGTLTYGGMPYDWMLENFGPDVFEWPSPNADSDGDGASNRAEFLAGTDPLNANSVLRVRLEPTGRGLLVHWNTVPGLIYQLQSTTNFGAWNNVGEPSFAPGTTDSQYVGGGNAGYYRVIRLR